MYRILILALIAAIFVLTPFGAHATNNGVGDYVMQVDVCDANHILIQTKNEGWVFIYTPDVTTAAPWLLATALSLLNSGKQIGSFYEPTGTLVSTGCGEQAVEIISLAASNIS